MNALVIDIGSSNLKAAVVTDQGRRALMRRALPSFPRRPHPEAAVFEVACGDILTAVRALVDEAAGQWKLDAILFSTQMHGFVYHTPNREDVYISWQDSRCTLPLPTGRTALEELRVRLPAGRMAACGVDLKPSLGLCNLYALLHGETPPPEGGELFTLGSYLIHRLGGENVCHATNAAPLGMVDLPGHRWNQDVLSAAGLGHVALPRLAAGDFEVCGYCSAAGQSIPLFPDYGDQQVCVLGAMAGPGEAVINIATASQLSYNTPDFRPGPYEVRPFFSGTYLNTVSNMPGGRNLSVLTGFMRSCAQVLCGAELSDGAAWAAIEAQYVPEPSSLAVDTLFYPTEHRLDGGSISGIRPGELTVNSLLSAAYADMAQVYAQNLPRLCPALPTGLTCSGGVSWKNPHLLAAISARTGLTCHRSALPDEALGGLYRLALAACGVIPALDAQPDHLLTLD